MIRSCGGLRNAPRVDRMNVLIVGAGGREHALAWKITQSHRADHVFGGARQRRHRPGWRKRPIEPTDFAGLIRFAKENDVGLCVVGPEAPWPPASSTPSSKRDFGRSDRIAPPPNSKAARCSAKTSSAMPTSHRRLSGLHNSRRCDEVSQGSGRRARRCQGRRAGRRQGRRRLFRPR